MIVESEEYPLSDKELEELEERKTRREEIWDEIKEQVLDYIDNEHAAYNAVHEFNEQGFEFVDFDYDCDEYDFCYIWCVYGVAMGVKMYDAHKLEQLDAKVS